MPLPKIATPTYELVLPSSDRKIKYRPFLVKEEKLLIIAMESEDQKQITNAIKTVINNCILTRGIKVDKLSTFDIEGSVSIEESFELITACVEQIFNEEESWNSSDFTKKEMIDFLDQLNSKQLKEIESFFDTMPKLSHTIKITNPETKVKNEVVLEGLSSFFE